MSINVVPLPFPLKDPVAAPARAGNGGAGVAASSSSSAFAARDGRDTANSNCSSGGGGDGGAGDNDESIEFMREGGQRDSDAGAAAGASRISLQSGSHKPLGGLGLGLDDSATEGGYASRFSDASRYENKHSY